SAPGGGGQNAANDHPERDDRRDDHADAADLHSGSRRAYPARGRGRAEGNDTEKRQGGGDDQRDPQAPFRRLPEEVVHALGGDADRSARLLTEVQQRRGQGLGARAANGGLVGGDLNERGVASFRVAQYGQEEERVAQHPDHQQPGRVATPRVIALVGDDRRQLVA